jgi:uncharacterized repeat protein (TIGR01451 family)
MISKNFLRQIAMLFLLFNLCIDAIGQQYDPQVIATDQGNGDVLYTTSNCDRNDLRFFIFDDGFYTFEDNPTHHYPPSNTGHTAKVWFARAYDPDDPTLRYASNPEPSQNGPNNNPILHMPTNPMISNSWALRQYKEHYYMLVFRNTGNQPYSGCLDFYYNSIELDLNTAGILQYNNWVTTRTTPVSNEQNFDRRINWNFSNLSPGETRIVYIPMRPKLPIDAVITTASKVSINCTSNGPLVMTYDEVRATPHDPNHKSVDRTITGATIPYVPQSFTYKINFKNIGKWYANTVVVTDELAPFFDPATISMVGSKHQFTHTVNGSLLTLTFPNINLPGTKQTIPYMYDDDETESWVKFSICTRNGLPPSSIQNYATVYFDDLAGINTNETNVLFDNGGPIVLCGGYSSRVAGTSKAEDVTVSPNPVQGIATLNAFSDLNTSIQIINSKGEVLKKLNYERLEGETQIDLSDLPSGLYFIKVRNNELNLSLKLLKL